jgi:hypothetical protein
MSTKKKPEEHPEDREYRERGEREAAEFGAAIVATYVNELPQLILTYADGDAHNLLDELRDRFWAGDLPDAVREAKRGQPR